MVADRGRTKNPAGLIVALLRERPPELLEREGIEQQRAADERDRVEQAARLARDRATVASIPQADWPGVVADACQLIRGRALLAKPEGEFRRFGQKPKVLQPVYVQSRC